MSFILQHQQQHHHHHRQDHEDQKCAIALATQNQRVINVSYVSAVNALRLVLRLALRLALRVTALVH